MTKHTVVWLMSLVLSITPVLLAAYEYLKMNSYLCNSLAYFKGKVTTAFQHLAASNSNNRSRGYAGRGY